DSTWGAEALTEHRPGFDWLLIVQVTPVPDPAGDGKFAVKGMASPDPVFLTVTVNPIGSPAVSVAPSAVLVMSITTGWEVIDADAWSVPSLVVVTWAVLSYFVHSLAEVVAVMCTVNVPPAPAGRSTGPQDSVCAPLGLTEHRPGFDWVSIVQVTPDPDPA